MPTAEQSSEFLLRRPLFSWTRIKGESDVQGGGGNGSITEGGGGGTNGGSTEGARRRSARRRSSSRLSKNRCTWWGTRHCSRRHISLRTARGRSRWQVSASAARQSTRSFRPRVSDRVSVVLTVPAQPAQEFADILFSLRRDPFDPAFFKATITFPNAFVASNNVCKQICCQVRPHCSWLPAAPSELLHPRDRPIPRG